MFSNPIDINQRIPLFVLDAALMAYLNDEYSSDYVLQQLRLEYEGENRIKKGVRIVNKIIPKNPLADKLVENREVIKNAVKNKTDRNIIFIALLNAAFPFAYDVLFAFGKFFTVQDEVNTKVIKKEIANVYGGNRAMENGLYSVVPMLLEANFFTRPQMGLYAFGNELQYLHEITKELYIEVHKERHNLDNLLEHQLLNPYFLFIET